MLDSSPANVQLGFEQGLLDVARPLSVAQSRSMVRDTSSSSSEEDTDEILLVDEVDVFFGSDFYGKTHNQVAVVEALEVEDLLREVWKYRDHAANTPAVLEQIKQCVPFRVLLQKFASFADIVSSEVTQMCLDLRVHMETARNERDYIFDGKRIGYKVMDGVAFDVVKGYTTAFAYLEEAAKHPLPDEAAVMRNALTMRIPCGRFSYAKLGSSKILGVSGTVAALGAYEWQVMRSFGVKSYTLVPSIYGRNNFAFLNQTHGEPITISTDQDHYYDIATQAHRFQIWSRRLRQML